MNRRHLMLALATLLVSTGAVLTPSLAEACGCFSPPIPDPASTDAYAVNQQSEQIVFEQLDEETVRAHILIRYAGDPASFAWIVPVPEVPELALSPLELFGLVDAQTSPIIDVFDQSICPDPEFGCDYRSRPQCPVPQQSTSATYGVYDTSNATQADASAGSDTWNSDPGTSGVTVVKQEVVGEYETIVFSAEEAAAAVTWLQDNGFVVNDTTTPYMEPYVMGGMYFVAARLVPGAGLDAIKPLQMTYTDLAPMVPLVLTAVAAEPHLTVTTWVFGNDFYKPAMEPLIELDEADLDRRGNRVNYPMMLAREIDEFGGAAFVREYADLVDDLVPYPGASGCCSDSNNDSCGIESDGLCQCPGRTYDALDCAADPDLADVVEAAEMLSAMLDTHTHLTRLTTRVSPEEMDFDPIFIPDPVFPTTFGPIVLTARPPSFEFCAGDVVDTEAYGEITARAACATVYCGEGTCGVNLDGQAGCICDEGFVAREFSDYDGLPSVTCVPAAPPVDIGLNLQVPDLCANTACGKPEAGASCVDVGGTPACRCLPGQLAILDDGVLTCTTPTLDTGDPGATRYIDPIADLEVCRPRQTDLSCGVDGWVVSQVRSDDPDTWTSCYDAPPAASFEPKPDLYCDDGVLREVGSKEVWEPEDEYYPPNTEMPSNPKPNENGSCECSTTRSDGPLPVGTGVFALLAGLGLVVRRRRRKRQRR